VLLNIEWGPLPDRGIPIKNSSWGFRSPLGGKGGKTGKEGGRGVKKKKNKVS
jgi:hypothetical protein